MITFQLKGEKHVTKQVGDHVQLHRPLQSDRHSVPNWLSGRQGHYTKVTRIHCERFPGDFDIMFEASPDIELSIDYQKGDTDIGIYHHKGIRRIGLFEHDTCTLITEINIPNGSKAPITFNLSSLAYFGGSIYYQGFYEFWKKASDYAQDFGLSGLQMDAGDLTSPVTDHHDCNVQNVGEGIDYFDFN